jgi:superoxide dismutase, Cu-Zn family
MTKTIVTTTFKTILASLLVNCIFTQPLMADDTKSAAPVNTVNPAIIKVVIHAISADGVGKVIGLLTLKDTADALEITPDIIGLKPGAHGFHVHVNPSCDAVDKTGKKAAGAAAGGHYDPANTSTHGGPYSAGHDGDLSILMVNTKGKTDQPINAPRLRLADVIGHSFIIHAESDNYSDVPKPLGGTGARVACGVVLQ